MVVKPKLRYTYLDYLDLPETALRCELIDGEYYIMSGASEKHQFAVLYIAGRLLFFVMDRGLGIVLSSPFDVILSPDDVFQPDVLFVSNERAHLRTGDNIRGAPDLVIEVLSPSTEQRDLTIKRERYAQFGVREYWIGDADAKSVERLTARDGVFVSERVYTEGETLQSPLLPGFALDVSRVFPEL